MIDTRKNVYNNIFKKMKSDWMNIQVHELNQGRKSVNVGKLNINILSVK